MGIHGASDQITQKVLSWEGMSAHPHRFGGTEYRLGSREVGHIHGDYMVDIPFPVKVRQQLVSEGRAQVHHLLPDTGWVSFYIKQPDDVEKALALFSASYEIAQDQLERRQQRMATV